MISLSKLSRELASYIASQTGLAAYSQRISTGVYPMYAVSLRPESMLPMAGGKQVLWRVAVQIACYPSRQRNEHEGLDMADRLAQALLFGLPLCQRHFSPQDCRWQENDNILTLSFMLEFYDVSSEDISGSATTVPMQSLDLRLQGHQYF